MQRVNGPLGQGEVAKYHALGNDYLVVDAETFGSALTPARVVALCHRHLGAGSDGILARVPASGGAAFGLRIYNPDGSEAEKSGNGLRIFARFLHDFGYTQATSFAIDTPGGRVEAVLRPALEGGIDLITVAMGRASFFSDLIPVTGPRREVVEEALVLNPNAETNAETLQVTCVTVGNPHCVVFVPRLSVSALRRLGPQLETHARFPNRINVQLAHVVDRSRIEILIWERGAGETMASGSSSCAVAAAARRLNRVDRDVTMVMPGGTLHITVGDDFALTMAGPATPVYRARLLC